MTESKAIEKQMLKKVRYEDVGYDQYGNVNVYACICPSCALEIIKFDDTDVSLACFRKPPEDTSEPEE